MTRSLLIVALAALVSGCAISRTERLSETELLVDVTAAPVCGREGAEAVALRVAALETLKAGFGRFVILESQKGWGENTLFGKKYYEAPQVRSYAPIFIQLAPAPPMPLKKIRIRLLKADEDLGVQALDARSVLGPDLDTALATGILTCPRPTGS